jgi:hypothetical protein
VTLIKSLDERIADQRERRKLAEIYATISFAMAGLLFLLFLLVRAENSGSGAAYYFAAEGVFFVFLMVAPMILTAIVAGIAFSVKVSRATDEIRRLKQILRSQQTQ